MPDGKTGALTITAMPQRQAIGTSSTTSSQGSGSFNLVGNSNGKVYAWGANPYGVLGQNTNVSSASLLIPTLVKDTAGTGALSGIVQPVAGYTFSFALSEAGNVYSWGDNSSTLGRLPVGTDYLLPGLVRNSANTGNLSNIVQVASGYTSVAALADDGRVFSWGYYHGQGTTSGVAYPNYVRNTSNTGDLSNIVSISVGSGFTLALASDGTVYSWGWNSDKQLGSGPTSASITYLPSQVLTAAGTPLTGVVAISAGNDNGMALTASGKVYAWGDGGSVLGQGGSSVTDSAYALAVKNSTGTQDLTGIAAIAAGGSHMLALSTTGTVWAWGFRPNGQLGEGLALPSGNDSFLPLAVVQTSGTGQLSNIIGIKAGYNHSLAVTSTGDVLIWGDGFGGNLGQNSTSTANLRVPTPVKDAAGTGTLNVGTVSAFKNWLNRGL